MIFSMADHIEQIKNGTKTQTRRISKTYLVGKTYSIQPGRTKPGISEGRCLEMANRKQYNFLDGMISASDALAEGGYSSGSFESLFQRMYPTWTRRYAYTLEFVPSSSRIKAEG